MAETRAVPAGATPWKTCHALHDWRLALPSMSAKDTPALPTRDVLSRALLARSLDDPALVDDDALYLDPGELLPRLDAAVAVANRQLHDLDVEQAAEIARELDEAERGVRARYEARRARLVGALRESTSTRKVAVSLLSDQQRQARVFAFVPRFPPGATMLDLGRTSTIGSAQIRRYLERERSLGRLHRLGGGVSGDPWRFYGNPKVG
jgi:hypothetical protein